MKKFHYKLVDEKSKAIQKCSLIKTNLTMSEGTGFFALPRKTYLGICRELKPILKLTKGIYF